MTHLEAQSRDMEERDGSIYRLISDNPCMSSPCLNGAACQTGFGCQGYRCACLQGYQGILCELDIDECTSQTHDCSPNSECTNMQGSFQCECKSGFTGDGKTCDGYECTNMQGSFQCECKSGFTGDGKTCDG
ncbi:unnamed protein product [Porites evermanni]|uniref:EGF-like domain-containing protein n=1 Tax=Porites evermanni TaxID=104178 RepID=A0ABN8SY37_9CNID|nr:unnamed protein product [Porites evermanni]